MDYVYEDLTDREYTNNAPGKVLEPRQPFKEMYNDRIRYIMQRWGIGDNESCIYVAVYGRKYYVGSTNSLAGRYKMADLQNMWIVVGAGKVLKQKVLRAVEQDTIDYLHSLGYTLINRNRAIKYRRGERHNG